jgi:hypothetical protein
MNPLSKLKKVKKRRVLVISGGGVQSGIQCLYLKFNGDWDLLASSFSPYPQKISDFFELVPKGGWIFQNLRSSWFDYKKFQHFLTESAKTAFDKTTTGYAHLITLY